MKREWNDIKWVFEPDGGLRDLYVQDVTIADWERLIDHLNDNFSLSFSGQDRIDRDHVIRYLKDASGEMECESLTIHLGQIQVKCHFFLEDQIEFDIDPGEFNSLTDFERIERFMISVSEALHRQVTLTPEGNPEFPLFKVDTMRGVNKVLTRREADRLTSRWDSVSNVVSHLRIRLELAFFPGRLKRRILESANREHKSTPIDKNVW